MGNIGLYQLDLALLVLGQPGSGQFDVVQLDLCQLGLGQMLLTNFAQDGGAKSSLTLAGLA